MLFKLSNLNLNLALTLFYLNPSGRKLKRSAQDSAHPLSQAHGGLFCVLTGRVKCPLFVKFTRCERLLLVEVCKAFLFFCCCCCCCCCCFSSLENYFGFRTTSVKGKTDHSVSLRWNKHFEHFQRGEYFSVNCAFEF